MNVNHNGSKLQDHDFEVIYNCQFQNMGNEGITNSSALQTLQDLEYTHLGPASLMQKDQQYCLLKTFSYSDHFLMEDRYRKLKSRSNKATTTNSVLNIYQVIKRQRKQICAHNYQLLTYLEKFDETLSESISKRLSLRKNYTQQQLFSFLAKVVDSLLYIQDNGLKNIQLDSDAIVICGQNVKVFDSGIAFSKSYLSLLEHRQKQQKYEGSVYLAPELLKEIEEMNYDPYISPKADVFSLGMILMEMVALQSMRCYYDYSFASIDYDSLIHRLSRINHSLSLKTLIAEMLQYDPEERIGLVSLKEKIQRLRVPEQGIVRSKSSKMLQDILSNSRRSSSICKRSQQSASLSRQPSSEKKMPHKLTLKCSAHKLLNQLNTNRSQTQRSVAPLTSRPQNIQEEMNESSQTNLKNLVKNKLKSTKDKEHPQSKFLKPFRKETQILPEPKALAQVRPMVDPSRNSNMFSNSLRSQRYDESLREKQNSKAAESNLNKLAEESGFKKILKLQHLETSGAQRNHLDSHKNTSRFGNSEHQSSLKQRKSKPSDIYIQQYMDEDEKAEPAHQESAKPQRTLQKVMTFNKDLFLNARSVDNSIEDVAKSKTAFSGHSDAYGRSNEHILESQEKYITIKDVPVVISQEKTYLGMNPPPHFGKLQRQLNLLECIQSVHHGSSVNSSFNNTSNVIESYRPREQEDSSGQFNPFSDRSFQPFKKPRAKKPQLVINLHDEDQPHSHPESFNSKPRQSLKPLTEQFKSTQSIEHISNYTSISPPNQQKDSTAGQDYLDLTTSPDRQDRYTNRIRLPSGQEYEGQMFNQLPHGNGVIYQAGRVKYSGSFQFGKYSGYGTLNNLEYRPEIIDHRFIELDKNYWSRFEGQFQHGMMSGFGTVFFGDAEKFSGCLKAGIIQGYGCFYRRNGELISGLWSGNKFNKV